MNGLLRGTDLDEFIRLRKESEAKIFSVTVRPEHASLTRYARASETGFTMESSQDIFEVEAIPDELGRQISTGILSYMLRVTGQGMSVAFFMAEDSLVYMARRFKIPVKSSHMNRDFDRISQAFSECVKKDEITFIFRKGNGFLELLNFYRHGGTDISSMLPAIEKFRHWYCEWKIDNGIWTVLFRRAEYSLLSVSLQASTSGACIICISAGKIPVKTPEVDAGRELDALNTALAEVKTVPASLIIENPVINRIAGKARLKFMENVPAEMSPAEYINLIQHFPEEGLDESQTNRLRKELGKTVLSILD